MKIGIMTVKGPDFHPNQRLIQEAEKQGHDIVLINPYAMGCRISSGGLDTFFDPDHMSRAHELAENGLPDLLMPKQGSPMGEYGFVLLRHFAGLGIPMVNGIDGVTIAKHQYITLQQLSLAGLPVPESMFVTRKENFFAAIKALGGFPVVVKQVDGMGGDGVAKLDSRDGADAYIDKYFVSQKGVVVQPFLDRIHDVRLLVTGGRVAAAMALTPAPGQFRTNIHQKAQSCAFDPTEEMARTAVRAAQVCCLEIAGVDVMVTKDHGIKVVEVNYSPGFRGLEAATGKNIAKVILDHVVAWKTNLSKKK